MKTKKIFIFCFVFLSSNLLTNAQSTTSGPGVGNIWAATKFVGWGATSGDLPIRTNGITRMLIQNNTGFLGVGNNFLAPQSRLHQHQPSPTFTYHQFTNSITTAAANRGMQVGIDGAGNAQVINNETNLPIQFWLKSAPFQGIPGTLERVRFTANNYFVNQLAPGVFPVSTDITRVGIWLNGSNPAFNDDPVTMLQIGEPLNTALNFGNGFRDWMNVGTYYNQESDNMYVGLRVYSLANGFAMDKAEAIINWGNNPSLIAGVQNNIGDKLRFVFTGAPGNGQASTYEGLEVSRMVLNKPTAATIEGRMGIGGDPVINPYSAGSVPVGNNSATLTSDPQNTLEINSPALNAGVPNGHPAIPPLNTPSTGFSGLRLTDLNIGSVPEFNLSANVLSVDNNGDVILVPDAVGAGVGSCNTMPTTFSPGDHGAINLGANNNNFYFEGNNAGPFVNSVVIGNNCGYVPTGKLDVLQASGSTSTIGINVLNTDNGIGFSGGTAAIGIKSRVNGCNAIACRTIAGWFEAGPGAGFYESAIVVPEFGGKVSIGYAPAFPIPSTVNPTTSALLEVKGTTWGANAITGAFGFYTVSDNQLKQDISAYSSGLSVIRQINPITYRFNGAAGLPTDRSQIGVRAQDMRNISEISEFSVDTIKLQINSEDAEMTDVLTFNSDAIVYTSLNAIKELDLAVTALQNNSGVDGAGTDNYLTKWSGASTITNSTIFENSNNGNVGIGTNNPDFQLVVKSNTDTKIMASTTSTDFYGAGSSFTLENLGSARQPYMEFQMIGSDDPLETYVRYNYVERSPLHVATDLLTIKGNGNVGIGTSSPSEALYVVGNIFATGTITQNSDATLKQNVLNIPNGMNIINQLKPYTFNFDTTQYDYLHLPSGRQFGLIAQEVEPVLPELVTNSYYPAQTDSFGNITQARVDYKGVNYTALIPILIKGMKEQDSIIRAQNIRLETLESTVSTCCSTNAKTVSSLPSTDMELSSKSAVLWQNFPNPFGDGTVIRYYVPESTGSANIVFYDEFGNEIKNMELPHKGQKAELNLSTMNLASGIYSYSLVVNGKIVDTKRMVKAK